MTGPDPLDILRRDRAALEAELLAAGSSRKGKRWHCGNPDHPDNHPSAWNYADDNRVWRHKCGACGFCEDIFGLRAAVQGRDVAEVLREAREATTPPKPATKAQDTPQAAPTPDMAGIAKRYYKAIADTQRQALSDLLGVSVNALRRQRVGWCERDRAYSWPMRDGAGKVIGVRLRGVDGGKWAERGSKSGIFTDAEPQPGGVLAFVEGPSDHAATLDTCINAIGLPSNNDSAAIEYAAAYIQAHPCREAWIIHDNDPAGSAARKATLEAAERLASRLLPLVGTVRVFSPPAEYKDVRAWRLAGATLDDLQAAADSAEARGPAADLRKVLEAEISGERRAIGWPWRLVERGTQALLPGTVTLLVGDAGSGKSLWLLEALAYWHDAGVPVACYMLEQDRSYHMKRALAQRTGAAWLCDLEQVAQRPSDALAYHAEHADWLNGLGRRIADAPDKPVSLTGLIDWTAQQCKAGARVIAVDPITAADDTGKPWDDARQFLHTTMPILDKHGASLVLVSHPKKGKQRGTLATMDDLAGGAAWVRFSQTILWLERHDDPRSVTVRRYGDPLAEAADITRTLRILKARNGKGGGWALGYELEPGTLRFSELGAIVKADATHTQEL